MWAFVSKEPRHHFSSCTQLYFQVKKYNMIDYMPKIHSTHSFCCWFKLPLKGTLRRQDIVNMLLWQKKRDFNILNGIRKSMIERYTDYSNILKLIRRYRIIQLDKILSNYSKFTGSVAEIEDQYEQMKKELQRHVSYHNRNITIEKKYCRKSNIKKTKIRS